MPGGWFWTGLWCLVVAASLWQYRHTLRASLEEYDPSSATTRDSYRLVVMLPHEGLLRYATGPFFPTGIYYRPLSAAYFWARHRALGVEPLGWRLVAMAWHAAAVTLLGLLVATCAGSRTPGVLAAGWFAWRGAHSEVVTWIAANPDLVAASMSLASVIVLWRVRWPYWLRVGGAAGLLLGALLTKESAAFMPVFFAATVWLWPVPEGAKRRALALGILAAVSLAYLGVYFSAVGNPAGPAGGSNLPALSSCLRRYAHLMWPPILMLRVFSPCLQLGWLLLLSAALWELVWQHLVYYGGASLLLSRARRAALIFATWLMLAPLPTLHCLSLPDERYLYPASMGWAALAGLLMWQAGRVAATAVRARLATA